MYKNYKFNYLYILCIIQQHHIKSYSTQLKIYAPDVNTQNVPRKVGRQILKLFMVSQLDIKTNLWLFSFLFTVTVTVRRFQSVSLYCNLLLLLYSIPQTGLISMSISLFVSVYGDVRSYCPLLSLSHHTIYCLLSTIYHQLSTVLFLLRLLYCSYAVRSLYFYSIAALTLLSCSADYN